MAGDGRNLTYPQFDYGSNTVQLEFDNNRRPELLSAIIVKRQSNDENGKAVFLLHLGHDTVDALLTYTT